MLAPRYIGTMTRQGYVRPGLGAPMQRARALGVGVVYVNASPSPTLNFEWANIQATKASQSHNRTFLSSALQYARAGLSQITKNAANVALNTLLTGVTPTVPIAQGAAIIQSVVAQAIPLAMNQGFAGLPRGFGALPAVPNFQSLRPGFGALNTTDPTLGTTSSALSDDLNSNGCQQTAQADVTAFQNAYNAAGGSPALKVDGLYGANVAAALQTVMNGPVAAACVAPAPTATSSDGSSSDGSTTPAVNVDASSNTDLLPIAIGVVAASGLVGLAIYAKKKRGYIFRKPRRR